MPGTKAKSGHLRRIPTTQEMYPTLRDLMVQIPELQELLNRCRDRVVADEGNGYLTSPLRTALASFMNLLKPTDRAPRAQRPGELDVDGLLDLRITSWQQGLVLTALQQAAGETS